MPELSKKNNCQRMSCGFLASIVWVTCVVKKDFVAREMSCGFVALTVWVASQGFATNSISSRKMCCGFVASTVWVAEFLKKTLSPEKWAVVL